MMKKIFCLIFPVIFAFCITGCNNEEEETVSMYDLQKAVLAVCEDYPEMNTVNGSADDAETLFTYISDIDYDKVDGFFLSYAAAGEAYEIAVVRMKDSREVNEMVQSLNSHVEDRVRLYQNYQPEQVSQAESAEVFSNGKYAVLIMSGNQSDVKAAFEKAINS